MQTIISLIISLALLVLLLIVWIKKIFTKWSDAFRSIISITICLIGCLSFILLDSIIFKEGMSGGYLIFWVLLAEVFAVGSYYDEHITNKK